MAGLNITVEAGTGGQVGEMTQAGVILGGVGNEVSGEPSREAGSTEGLENVTLAVKGPAGNLKIDKYHQAGVIKGGVGNKQVHYETEERAKRIKEDCYVMQSNPRGLCYIFSNKDFNGKPSQKRTGNEKDIDALDKVFKKLKFEVKLFKDFKEDEMREKLKKLAEQDHKPYDCVVVIFLTHGEHGKIQGSDNNWLKINEVTVFFTAERCKSLANKPKLFFFQSCRGSEYQKAVKVQGDDGNSYAASDNMEASVGADGGETDALTSTLFAPGADFFFGYAAIPGTKALRNPETGSWYIQALADTLDKSADREDLLSMMTKVKKLVSERKVECTDGSFLTQTAETTSRLLKKLYF